MPKESEKCSKPRCAERWKTEPPRTHHRLKQIRFIILLVALVASISAKGQINNLSSFDGRLLHYGIQVGYTSSKFDLKFSENSQLRDTMQGVTSYYNAGFHIAVIGDLRIWKYFNLRLLPGVTIINRELSYSWEQAFFNAHPRVDTRRNVESVYGEIPLEFRYRAMRWRNFRPYVTGGITYGFDFSSLRKNKNNNDEAIVRLNPHEVHYTVGFGLDFFLKYVKFAIDLKAGFGIINLWVEDDDIYSRSADYLKSRTLMISFTFEG